MYKLMIINGDRGRAQDIRRMVEHTSRAREFDIICPDDIAELESMISSGEHLDALFMDTDIGGCGKGIEAVERLFPRGCGTQVIYTTEHIECSTVVYRTEHVYLLLEPITLERLSEALDKALARLDKERVHPIEVRCDGKVTLLDPSEVFYVESDLRKVRFHMANEVVEEYGSLANIAQELPPCFARSHKSYLVNMEQVVLLQENKACLSNGDTVPVSRKRSRELHDALSDYLRTWSKRRP